MAEVVENALDGRILVPFPGNSRTEITASDSSHRWGFRASKCLAILTGGDSSGEDTTLGHDGNTHTAEGHSIPQSLTLVELTGLTKESTFDITVGTGGSVDLVPLY